MASVRGRGRPPIGDRLECRFPPDQRSEIDGLAEQWGVRPPEVVRRLVDLGLSALGGQVAATFQSLKERKGNAR